jgi:hypothetical protein
MDIVQLTPPPALGRAAVLAGDRPEPLGATDARAQLLAAPREAADAARSAAA